MLYNSFNTKNAGTKMVQGPVSSNCSKRLLDFDKMQTSTKYTKKPCFSDEGGECLISQTGANPPRFPKYCGICCRFFCYHASHLPGYLVLLKVKLSKIHNSGICCSPNYKDPDNTALNEFAKIALYRDSSNPTAKPPRK